MKRRPYGCGCWLDLMAVRDARERTELDAYLHERAAQEVEEIEIAAR